MRLTTHFLLDACRPLQVYAMYGFRFCRIFYFTEQLRYTYDKTLKDPQIHANLLVDDFIDYDIGLHGIRVSKAFFWAIY